MARTSIPLLLVLLLSSGCASPLFDVGRSETVLPLKRAWVDGKMVEYVLTDVSDLKLARMTGTNFAPRLALATQATVGQSVLERVYKFVNEEQVSVFQSGPQPIGSESQDRSYSPLWRLVSVRWIHTANLRELRSEAEVLAAEDRKEIELQVTEVVINCPITREAGGRGLNGVR